MGDRICQYYLRGYCRFGERCWYRHPGYGEGPGQPAQGSGSSRRGGWGGPNQREPVVQASRFSKPSSWHSSRDQGKALAGSQADLSFSQNRFGALNSNEEARSDGMKNEDENLLDIIMKDMEFWESSGQWMFSSYSPSKEKPNISGFPAFSPEELRLEYYNCRANNNIQNYVNSVQQLITQWRSRLRELKNINASTKVALISELKNPANQAPPAFGFGGQPSSAFGTSTFLVNKPSSAKSFSFKSPSELASGSFGSPPAFGSLTVQSHPTLAAASLSTTPTPTPGFGNQTASSAASFSFTSTATPVGFGTSGFSGFKPSPPASSSNSASATVFGVSNIPPPLDSRNTLFGQPTNVFGSSAAPARTQTSIVSEKLFTPKTELSADELKQFEAKKFTLGKIPLKPPPVELLNV